MDVHRGKSGISLRQKSNLLLPITKKCRKRRLTFIIEKYSKVCKINEIKKRREKRDKINVSPFFSIMPQTGIEPVREYKSRRILSPVRLPVPPLRHTKYFKWMEKDSNRFGFSKPVTLPFPYDQWMEKDSNLRRRCQQIYSLPPLATRESIHFLEANCLN